MRLMAGIGDFLDCRKPSFFRWKSGYWMGHSGDNFLGIARQDSSYRSYVGLRIVCLTRAIAAQQQLGPRRCVARQILLTGHRNWQFFG